jgi:hypothetical protein
MLRNIAIQSIDRPTGRSHSFVDESVSVPSTVVPSHQTANFDRHIHVISCILYPSSTMLTTKPSQEGPAIKSES